MDVTWLWDERTICRGLRRHINDQVWIFKSNDRLEVTKVRVWHRTDEENALTENERDWGSRLGRYVPGSAQELRERLSQEQDIVEVCCNSGESFQRKCGLHSDWWSGCLDCRWNISVENNRIYVGTWQADRPRSRLHDGIVTCLIASKTVELFKILECRHWAPKFDIWALKMILLFLLHFSIVSSASLVVLVWQLDCRRLHSFLIPKRSLFIGFFLLLDGSCAIDGYNELVFILCIRIVLTLCDMDSKGCLYPSRWDNLSTDLGCVLHISFIG